VSTFDSTTRTFGNWCGRKTPTPLVQAQTNGPDVVVIPFKNLTVAMGSTIRITGSLPVVFAVFGDTTIAGTIDASASRSTPGPGGTVACGAGNGTPGDDGVIGSGTSGPCGGGGRLRLGRSRPARPGATRGLLGQSAASHRRCQLLRAELTSSAYAMCLQCCLHRGRRLASPR
jgi:hypothetical protein